MILKVGAVLAAALVFAACAGGSGSDGPISGEALANNVGCDGCHTQADTDLAPTWTGLWSSEVELEDGSTVTADEEYIRRSIEEPRAEIVAGYGPTMPSMGLTDEEVSALVEYIKSLG